MVVLEKSPLLEFLDQETTGKLLSRCTVPDQEERITETARSKTRLERQEVQTALSELPKDFDIYNRKELNQLTTRLGIIEEHPERVDAEHAKTIRQRICAPCRKEGRDKAAHLKVPGLASPRHA